MLGIIVTLMVVLATIYSLLISGNIEKITESVLSSGTDAINISITIIGSMAIWGGLLRVLEDTGVTERLSNLFLPIFMKIFNGLGKGSRALKAITMNVVANLLGLGNAATPLGIEAMKLLEEEEATGKTASRNMITFAILNTSSIQIIPTTVIALRVASGSASPAEIIPCVIAVSAITLLVCVILVYIFDRFKGNGGAA